VVGRGVTRRGWHGTFHAPILFVGMEEGGGGSLDVISRRLAASDTRGRCELEDVAERSHSASVRGGPA
jgi:hypothetical protein